MTAPAVHLLQQAGDGLAAASSEPAAPRRFAAAHLAALRGAAAVLAARALPRASAAPVAGRPTSAWELLGEVAPELGEWAEFFAACAPVRAGRQQAVSVRTADDMVRQVEQFLTLAEHAVRGRGPQPSVPPSRAREARLPTR